MPQAVDPQSTLFNPGHKDARYIQNANMFGRQWMRSMQERRGWLSEPPEPMDDVDAMLRSGIRPRHVSMNTIDDYLRHQQTVTELYFCERSDRALRVGQYLYSRIEQRIVPQRDDPFSMSFRDIYTDRDRRVWRTVTFDEGSEPISGSLRMVDFPLDNTQRVDIHVLADALDTTGDYNSRDGVTTVRTTYANNVRIEYAVTDERRQYPQECMVHGIYLADGPLEHHWVPAPTDRLMFKFTAVRDGLHTADYQIVWYELKHLGFIGIGQEI